MAEIDGIVEITQETVTGKSLPEDCSLPAGDAAVDTELANHSEDSEVKQTESSTNQANHQQPIDKTTDDKTNRDDKLRVARLKQEENIKRRKEDYRNAEDKSNQFRIKQSLERSNQILKTRERVNSHRNDVELRRKKLQDDEKTRRQSIVNRSLQREANKDGSTNTTTTTTAASTGTTLYASMTRSHRFLNTSLNSSTGSAGSSRPLPRVKFQSAWSLAPKRMCAEPVNKPDRRLSTSTSCLYSTGLPSCMTSSFSFSTRGSTCDGSKSAEVMSASTTEISKRRSRQELNNTFERLSTPRSVTKPKYSNESASFRGSRNSLAQSPGPTRKPYKPSSSSASTRPLNTTPQRKSLQSSTPLCTPRAPPVDPGTTTNTPPPMLKFPLHANTPSNKYSVHKSDGKSSISSKGPMKALPPRASLVSTEKPAKSTPAKAHRQAPPIPKSTKKATEVDKPSSRESSKEADSTTTTADSTKSDASEVYRNKMMANRREARDQIARQKAEEEEKLRKQEELRLQAEEERLKLVREEEMKREEEAAVERERLQAIEMENELILNMAKEAEALEAENKVKLEREEEEKRKQEKLLRDQERENLHHERMMKEEVERNERKQKLMNIMKRIPKKEEAMPAIMTQSVTVKASHSDNSLSDVMTTSMTSISSRQSYQSSGSPSHSSSQHRSLSQSNILAYANSMTDATDQQSTDAAALMNASKFKSSFLQSMMDKRNGVSTDDLSTCVTTSTDVLSTSSSSSSSITSASEHDDDTAATNNDADSSMVLPVTQCDHSTSDNVQTTIDEVMTSDPIVNGDSSQISVDSLDDDTDDITEASEEAAAAAVKDEDTSVSQSSSSCSNLVSTESSSISVQVKSSDNSLDEVSVTEEQSLNEVPVTNVESLNEVSEAESLNEVPVTEKESLNEVTDTEEQSLNDVPVSEKQSLNEVPVTEAESLNEVPVTEEQSLNELNNSTNQILPDDKSQIINDHDLDQVLIADKSNMFNLTESISKIAFQDFDNEASNC